MTWKSLLLKPVGPCSCLCFPSARILPSVVLLVKALEETELQSFTEHNALISNSVGFGTVSALCQP